MFSYRHAFHAANHADVFKHTALLAILRYLTQKETALTVIDTHAGAGVYRLDGDYAQTSAEANDGLLRLVQSNLPQPLAPALQDYLELVAGFNRPGSYTVYPGSPFIVQSLLRPQDKLKLFELHPSDAKALEGNLEQLHAGRQIAMQREDGFAALKQFLPPPSRRALVICDPSYEIKSDYARVAELLDDSLRRFATGCYAIWYPVIPRLEAHELPRRLKTIANRAGKKWLLATLSVKSGQGPGTGLPASGMFIANPPHTLKATLAQALPQLLAALKQDRHAAFTLSP